MDIKSRMELVFPTHWPVYLKLPLGDWVASAPQITAPETKFPPGNHKYPADRAGESCQSSHVHLFFLSSSTQPIFPVTVTKEVFYTGCETGGRP